MSDNISLAGAPLISKDGNENLQDFQYNGVDYLYNLEPQQLNFFKPLYFFDPYSRSDDTQSTSTEQYGNTALDIPSGLEYRINKISNFKIPGLTIHDDDFDKGIRFNYVTKPGKNNSLQISWVEDSYQTIRRYHSNWVNHWYNNYLDCMVCGRKGKYRNLSICLFHYVNQNTSTGAPIFRAKPIAMITFKGLVPEQISAPEFDYGNSGNTSLVNITYKMNGAEVFFYPYELKDKEYIGDLAYEIQSGTDVSNVANTGIQGDTTWGGLANGAFGKVSDTNHEKVYYI